MAANFPCPFDLDLTFFVFSTFESHISSRFEDISYIENKEIEIYVSYHIDIPSNNAIKKIIKTGKEL